MKPCAFETNPVGSKYRSWIASVKNCAIEFWSGIETDPIITMELGIASVKASVTYFQIGNESDLNMQVELRVAFNKILC